MKKTFGNVVYEMWDRFPSEKAANDYGKSLLKGGWVTNLKITKNIDPHNKKPYLLWGFLDGSVSWRKKKKGVHLDSGMKPVIWELNANGMYTQDCCSGHGIKRGYIFFSKPTANDAKIQTILRKHGLKNIKKQRVINQDPGNPSTYYTFDSPVQKGR
jgi:hypothetical protein